MTKNLNRSWAAFCWAMTLSIVAFPALCHDSHATDLELRVWCVLLGILAIAISWRALYWLMDEL